eukprot:scaffold9715_cov113-Isochrysis_galbana.AAC.18
MCGIPIGAVRVNRAQRMCAKRSSTKSGSSAACSAAPEPARSAPPAWLVCAAPSATMGGRGARRRFRGCTHRGQAHESSHHMRWAPAAGLGWTVG